MMTVSDIGCPRCDGLVVTDRMVDPQARRAYLDTWCVLCGWHDPDGETWTADRRRHEICRLLERQAWEAMVQPWWQARLKRRRPRTLWEHFRVPRPPREIRMAVHRLLAYAAPREQAILSRWSGVDGRGGATLRAVAEELRLSVPWASLLAKRGLVRIRAAMRREPVPREGAGATTQRRRGRWGS